MNAIVPQNFGAVSTRFAGQVVENDLGAGISGGYGHVGYKGKVWSIRYKGEETVLMRPDGDGPRGSIEVVILKASTVISKVWYEKGYEEGSKAAPDCFSANGVTPDPTSAKKQANVCATCPRNAFGSAIKQDGTPGKGKACSDAKRLAVAPLADINNDMLGGPMLLRVPAGSLNDIATYGIGVQKLGVPYYGVGTRIAFDVADAFPKFVFSPIRPLTDAEADMVLALRNDPRVDRILAEAPYEPAAPAAAEPPGMAFEQPAPAAAAVAAPAGAPKAPPPAAQTAAPAQAGGFGAAAPAQPAPAQPAPSKSATSKPRAAKPTPQPAPAAPEAAAMTTGFGAMAPATAPAPTDADTASAQSFDDALDAELEDLMGPAA